jgi:hypothetical protein
MCVSLHRLLDSPVGPQIGYNFEVGGVPIYTNVAWLHRVRHLPQSSGPRDLLHCELAAVSFVAGAFAVSSLKPRPRYRRIHAPH